MTKIDPSVRRFLIMHELPMREKAREVYQGGGVLVDELKIARGSARVDLASIGKWFHGIELKSDGDSLNRLPRQVVHYSRVFEQVTLVVGYSHLYDALTMIPKWWGVSVAEYNQDGDVVFERVRLCLRNQNVDKAALLGMLTKLEMLEMAQAERIRVRQDFPVGLITDRLTDNLDEAAILAGVKRILVNRYTGANPLANKSTSVLYS